MEVARVATIRIGSDNEALYEVFAFAKLDVSSHATRQFKKLKASLPTCGAFGVKVINDSDVGFLLKLNSFIRKLQDQKSQFRLLLVGTAGYFGEIETDDDMGGNWVGATFFITKAFKYDRGIFTNPPMATCASRLSAVMGVQLRESKIASESAEMEQRGKQASPATC